MNILILGSGGREHAFAWKIKQSPRCDSLYVAPGNAGTDKIATNLPIDVLDFQAIKKVVVAYDINLVLVGPEVPLVEGICDFFKKDPQLNKVMIVGPEARAAQLEGSKEFAKDFMVRHRIPTAAYQSFSSLQLDSACRFLETLQPPYVLKADGLAAGKGVLILDNREEAIAELKHILTEGKFGNAGNKVVIEEFLKGIELSCFVLTDGKNYKILPTAKDYKRIGEGDTGLNTGGMGAISPVPFATSGFLKKVENRIVIPTIEGLKKENIPFVGFIFIGLMKVDDNPFVIEYNVRMGDPETEVVIPRVKSDWVALLEATSLGKLNEIVLEIDVRSAATVVMVSGGYPEAYKKGEIILGLDKVHQSLVFHAGTKEVNGEVLTDGGRVLAVTSFGDDYKESLEKSYNSIENISFKNLYYRKDLGLDLQERM
ncbi:MAG: phosphoribosylamine--glycine ligase [Flavobacteriales bacterium CG_4_9_14_3_um_filter_40_17]|nr:MAG: phosphoribosylamine--glycine ligase [Flavobacteriales bacterium CG_4_9_14_3_um_filter_40_17]